MARFSTLFSGSSGNSVFIGNTDTSILIDAGKSAKQIESALNEIETDPASIKAIFVTHEHTDHVAALRVLASRYHIPVYATKGTLQALDRQKQLNDKFDVFEIDKETDIGSLRIKKFKTEHDAAESCGYIIDLPDERRIAVVTDLGTVTDEVYNAVTGCDLVYLESNHDIGMLRNGPYPYPLKQRILSSKGHLSNEACADFAAKLIESGTTRFVLGHLSHQNNYPDLAYHTTFAAFEEMGAVQGRDYCLSVAPRLSPSELIVF